MKTRTTLIELLRSSLMLPALLLLATFRAPALEVDCRACNYCRDKRDLRDELNARILHHIAGGKSAAQIAELEGGGSIIRPPIEVWADAHPEAARPDRRLLKYRGSKLPDTFLFSAYEPCVKVCGVCLGTDKLGHMFQQGWEYYRIAVLDGKGDALATRYGEWLEGKETREKYVSDEKYFRRQRSGRLLGYGGFGRTMSGVISNADLAANLAGLQMYKDIARGKFESIANYVSEQLCEEVNCNEYTPEMKRLVERNGGR